MSVTESMNKNQLIKCFELALLKSDFLIKNVDLDCSKYANFYKFEIEKNKKDYCIFVNLSNINDAYIPNKPYIKRRQVGVLDIENVPKNTGQHCTILCGIKIFGEKIILSVWNPFYFTNHSKNRSCYVLEDSILQTLKQGTYFGVDCNTPVYLCDECNFELLLSEYLLKNRID